MNGERTIKKATEVIHSAFVEQGWTYFDGPPTIERVEETIRYLIGRVDEMDDGPDGEWPYFCATGRVHVQRAYYDGMKETSIFLSLGELELDDDDS